MNIMEFDPDLPPTVDQFELEFSGTHTLSCQIDWEHGCANINCTSTDRFLFNWTNLSPNNFEEVHALSRIVNLIPDKIATALYIHCERNHVLETGSFYPKQIVDLLQIYILPGNRPRNVSFTQTLISLSHLLQSFQSALDSWSTNEAQFIGASIISDLDPIRTGCQIYTDFLHPELVKNHLPPLVPSERRSIFSEAARSFLRLTDNIYNKKSLQEEYYQLMDSNM